MSLRRLHHEQPASFAFTPANAAWAEAQIAKYPQGRQASAVIPLLWRGQEQEGWISRPMIEEVARMLGMEQIRVLEVATFYFMFQLRPVGSVAHVQVCGTTSCMICGAEDLIRVCKEKIAKRPHEISSDGKFSWEEVECLGACANAPMAQIGKDYYEDLTEESLAAILDAFARGEVPTPGPQNGRFASEPEGGATTLAFPRAEGANGAVALATALGDTVKRIDGTEATATQHLIGRAHPAGPAPRHEPTPPEPGPGEREAQAALRDAETLARPPSTDIAADPPEPVSTAAPAVPSAEDKPTLLATARPEGADDLQRIKGVGPKLEGMLHALGVFHFDQIAAWSDREVAWVDYNLEGFKGRIVRDDWVAQAKSLATDSGGS
ncbi:MAG: NADH-quinone oxidoreductase subunit E [Paracoccaceae bacterium]